MHNLCKAQEPGGGGENGVPTKLSEVRAEEQ